MTADDIPVRAYPLTRCHENRLMVHGRWLDPSFTIYLLTTRFSLKTS